MSKPVRFALQARAEVLEAARRYGEQRPELRGEFLAPTLGVKRIFVKRFPFSVYFVELPTRFRVLAVAHNRQRPLYWQDRR